MADSRFFKNNGPFSLKELSKVGQVELILPANSHITEDYIVNDLANLAEADQGQITVLHNSKYNDLLKSSKANVCIIHSDSQKFARDDQALLVSKSPYRSFGLIAAHFYPDSYSMIYSKTGAKPISDSAKIGKNCHFEQGVIIGDSAEIGDNVTIAANTVIGIGVKIHDGCKIGANVTISHAIIGRCVIISPGVCIGQPGFGFHMDESGHIPVPQLGRVIIDDKVEIGSNTTLDRGSLSDTFIGAGSRIDNLVQIAHNVRLGRGCVIVSQVGISGSTEIGDYSAIGGQAGLTGHLKIGRGVKIAAQSGVIRDIDDGQTVGGYPAVPSRQWHKQTIAIEKLVKLK